MKWYQIANIFVLLATVIVGINYCLDDKFAIYLLVFPPFLLVLLFWFVFVWKSFSSKDWAVAFISTHTVILVLWLAFFSISSSKMDQVNIESEKAPQPRFDKMYDEMKFYPHDFEQYENMKDLTHHEYLSIEKATGALISVENSKIVDGSGGRKRLLKLRVIAYIKDSEIQFFFVGICLSFTRPISIFTPPAMVSRTTS